MKRILLLITIFTFLSCYSGSRVLEIDVGDLNCKLDDLTLKSEDGCIELSWRCEGGRGDEHFKIIREIRYQNRSLRTDNFVVDSEGYKDCDILKGLTYRYTINLNEGSSDKISGEIEVPPSKDFDVILPEKIVSGRLFEVTLDYHPSVDNPFDMSELDITMSLIKPDWSTLERKGFYMTEYDIVNENEKERFIRGEDKIKVRYLPDQGGIYLAYFTIKEKDKIFESGYYPIAIEEFERRGFVKVSSKNPLYFEDSDGRYFFPIGFNIGWARSKGLFEFQHYMDKMSDWDINLFRMWMIKWSNGIEWTEGNGNGDYKGLMRYAQDNAARIDKILSYAEEKGIKVILTLGSYSEFTSGGNWNEGAWHENPYNATNGGPCNNPGDFFTNEEAKRIYKNRLKYISARWGYSDSIFAYEFFNETYAPYEWALEMSAFLKRVDYSRHIISTTYGDDRIFGLKNIDFTMTHLYGNPPELIRDYPQKVSEISSNYASKYKKPFLLAEFGIDWSRSDIEYDPSGRAINFHNGVFAAISSGSAGTAMLWWWDDYIDKLDLYWVLSPVKRIMDEFGGLDGVDIVSRSQISSDSENIFASAISSEKKILIWIQNRNYSWYNDYNRIPYEDVSGEVNISGLKMKCKSRIVKMDTYSGEILEEYSSNIDSQLDLKVENLRKDIVIIARCM